MKDSVSILNVKLYSKSISSFISLILSCNNQKNCIISATGAHGIITAQKNKKFNEILNNFYLNLPDGMPGVWIGRLKGAKKMERCYGPDVFREVMITTSNLPIKHYFCGGKEGIAEELKKVCEEKFNNHNVVGTYSPPFREMKDEELKVLANDINNKETDIVWIGLSTPKQEIFAKRLSSYSNVHFIITVGAAFDFHTGKVKQAPRWVQKAGLEWLFRLIMEPKRLWKRYFEIVPLFIWYNLLEFLKGDFFSFKVEGDNIE